MSTRTSGSILDLGAYRALGLVLLAILSLLTIFTSAQSRLIFPRLAFEEGTLTGIADRFI